MPARSRNTVLRSQIEKLTECDENLSQIAGEVTRLQDELTEIRASTAGLTQLARDQEASLDEKELELSTLRMECALAQQRAEGATAELREAQARLSEHEERAMTLDRELQALRTGVEARSTPGAAGEPPGALAESRPSQVARPEGSIADDPITKHVRFIASPNGYRLSESDESCPRPGDLVEIDGRRFVVVRNGRSPLWGDARPCAFLMLG